MADKAPYKLVVKFEGAKPEKIAEALARLREQASECDLTGESTATMTIESWQEAPLRETMESFEVWLYRHAPGIVKDQGMVLYRPGLRPETAELLAREKRRTPMDSAGWEPPADETEQHEPIIIAPPLALPAPALQVAELTDGEFTIDEA